MKFRLLLINLATCLAITGCERRSQAEYDAIEGDLDQAGAMIAYKDYALLRTSHPGEIAVKKMEIDQMVADAERMADKSGLDPEKARKIVTTARRNRFDHMVLEYGQRFGQEK